MECVDSNINLNKSSDEKDYKSSEDNSVDDFENECPICFRLFDYSAKDEALISFPIDGSECSCKQIFHLKCIIDWLKAGGNTCPMCNKNVYIKNSNELIVSSREQLNESIRNIMEIQNYHPISSDDNVTITVNEPNDLVLRNNNNIRDIILSKNLLGIVCVSFLFIFFIVILILLFDGT